MENWGLITYRETALLFKPGVSALGNKQRIAIVIRYVYFYNVLITLSVPPDLCKVENILKGSLDLIPSPSPLVKIQINVRKVYLR